MKELISNNELTMSSREIAEFTGKRHDHVMRDIKKMLLELYPAGAPNFGGSYLSEQGKELPLFNLDRDHTDCLLTGYNTKARMAVIRRWKELEGKQLQPALPANYIEALESLIESEKEKALLNEQLQEAAPKVEFVDKYVQASTGSKTFREVCKILKVKENVFRAFLVENKIMYKSSGGWLAHAQHINAGRFETKTGVKNEHSYTTTKFTGKGVEWIAGEYTKAAIREIGLH
tara:strand:- start:508 stop:1203 length:696 start_codon:yes stop_codon:yes gene_type:complete